jgi:tetratricopeptide (TPR) repeat protein
MRLPLSLSALNMNSVDAIARARELYEKGRILMQEQRYKEAAEVFETSNKLIVHFKTLELLGECYLLLRRFDEAILPLAAATSLNKGVRAASLLAEACARAQLWSEAEFAVQQALQRGPQNRAALKIAKELKAVASEKK